MIPTPYILTFFGTRIPQDRCRRWRIALSNTSHRPTPVSPVNVCLFRLRHCFSIGQMLVHMRLILRRAVQLFCHRVKLLFWLPREEFRGYCCQKVSFRMISNMESASQSHLGTTAKFAGSSPHCSSSLQRAGSLPVVASLSR